MILDAFLQRASGGRAVRVENVLARAGPVHADERQRHGENRGAHAVRQTLDVLVGHELLLHRCLRSALQLARRLVAAGYLDAIGIFVQLSCENNALLDFRFVGKKQGRKRNNSYVINTLTVTRIL